MRGALFAACGLLLSAFPLTALAQAEDSSGAEEAAASLPEVRVVDGPLSDAASEAYSTTVIKGEALSAPGLSLADVLDAQAGAEVTRMGDAMAYSSISLRGTSGEQVALILDDIPLVSVLGGAIDLSHLPLAGLGKLTLIRGATPNRYGVSGMAGALLLETRRPRRDIYSASVGGGSFGERRAGLLYSAARKAASWLVSVDYAGQSGGFSYANDNGTRGTSRDDTQAQRRNNDADQLNLLLKGQLRCASQWNIKVLEWLYYRQQGLPGSGAVNAEKTRLRTLENLAAVVAEGPLAGSRLSSETRLSVQVGESRLLDPMGEMGLGSQRTNDLSLSPALNEVLTLAYAPALSQTLQLGYRYEWFMPRNEALRKRAKSERHILTAATELNAGLGASGLSVSAGADLAYAQSRVTARGSEDVGQDEVRQKDALQGAGRLALVAQARKDTRLFLAFGRAFRLPSLSELFGNQGLVLGNTQLRPETRVAYEMGASYDPVFRQGLAALHFALSAYLNDYRDLVTYTQNAQGLSRPENLDRARLYGTDAELAADLFAHLLLEGRYSWLHARNESELAARNGRALALRAAHKASGRLEVYAARLCRDLTKVSIYSTYDYSSSHYLDAANIKSVPAAHTADLGFGLEFFGSSVRLDGRVSNVGGARVYDLIGLPLPGRAFHFRAEWRWN